MVLKKIFIAAICATLSLWGGLSFADEYRADEFLGLDLSRAVLSPQPLGPASKFVPVPVVASNDRDSEAAQPSVKHVVHPARVVHARAEKPRAAVRTRLARRHGNPLDAQARDTRIQVWPCKSGGICNWKK